MKSILDKYLPKKFKVRVSYFGRDKYTVDYTYHRLIPTWYSLCFWFNQSLVSGTECWSTRLLYISDAETLAKKLKTIDDVREWYKPDEEKEKNFYRQKEEYYKKNVPYNTKHF